MVNAVFRRSTLYLLPVLVSLAGGCALFAPHDIVCTADPKFAFMLNVRDSVTNAFSLAGATIAWSSASRADSMTFAPGPGGTDPGYAAIDAPPGTYNLTVRKLRYRDWRRSGVQVGFNQCGLVAARIDVLLQPIVLPADTPVGDVVCAADLAQWATLAPRATYTRVFTWRTTDGRMIGPQGPAPLPAGLYDLESVIDAVGFQWVGRRLRVQVAAR